MGGGLVRVYNHSGPGKPTETLKLVLKVLKHENTDFIS